MVKVSSSSSSQSQVVPVEVIQPSPSLSWCQLATLFITDLLAPPAEMCQKAIEQIQQNGALGTMRRVGRALQQHPLEAFTLAGSLALGYCPSIAEKSVLIPTVLGTAAAVRNSQALTQIAKTIDGKTLIEQGVKWGCYSAAVYMICSVPATAALEWNTLSQAQAAYSGNPCDETLSQALKAVATCILEQNGIEVCHGLTPEKMTLDHQVFTHHSSGAVSSVELHNGGRLCFLTAPNPQATVTKTCFASITEPNSRTVEMLPEMTLAQSQEGLQVGDSLLHLAIHREPNEARDMLRLVRAYLRIMGHKPDEDLILESSDCGGFHEVSETTTLDHRKAVCLITALKPQGPVTQTCYNPDTPSQIVVKTIEGMEMDFQSDGKPVSLVIKNPSLLGLNPSVDSPSSSSDQSTMECKCKE